MKKGLHLLCALVILFSISAPGYASSIDNQANPDKALIEKLNKQVKEQEERLAKLEKKSDSTISWNGDIRFRWIKFENNATGNTQEAFRLKMNSRVNENTSFFGAFYVMRHTDFSHGSGAFGTNSKDDDQVIAAALTTKNFLNNKGANVTLGRYWDSIGATGYWMTGLGLDGVKLTFGDQLKVGLAYANFRNIVTAYGKVPPATYGNFKEAFYATASYDLDKKNTGHIYYLQNTTGPQLMKAHGVGLVSKLNNDITFKGDYVKNTSSGVINGHVDNGYVLRFLWRGAEPTKPNTWGLGIAAKKFGKAVSLGHHDYMPSALATVNDIENYELTTEWTLARNVVFRAIQTFDSKNPETGAKYASGEYTRLEINYFF